MLCAVDIVNGKECFRRRTSLKCNALTKHQVCCMHHNEHMVSIDGDALLCRFMLLVRSLFFLFTFARIEIKTKRTKKKIQILFMETISTYREESFW